MTNELTYGYPIDVPRPGPASVVAELPAAGDAASTTDPTAPTTTAKYRISPPKSCCGPIRRFAHYLLQSRRPCEGELGKPQMAVTGSSAQSSIAYPSTSVT